MVHETAIMPLLLQARVSAKKLPGVGSLVGSRTSTTWKGKRLDGSAGVTMAVQMKPGLDGYSYGKINQNHPSDGHGWIL